MTDYKARVTLQFAEALAFFLLVRLSLRIRALITVLILIYILFIVTQHPGHDNMTIINIALLS